MWVYIKAVTTGVWKILLPMLLQLMTKEGARLVDICKNAVAMAAKLEGKTGEEKMKYAIGIVMADLSREGIVFGTSIVRATIEAAYQYAKSEK